MDTVKIAAFRKKTERKLQAAKIAVEDAKQEEEEQQQQIQKLLEEKEALADRLENLSAEEQQQQEELRQEHAQVLAKLRQSRERAEAEVLAEKEAEWGEGHPAY